MDSNNMEIPEQTGEHILPSTANTIIEKYASNYQQQKYHNVGYRSTTTYLTINSCGIFGGYFPKRLISRLDGREDYYFLYNETGIIKVRTNEGVKPISPGCILAFKPKEKQIYWYDEPGYSKNYWIHFTGFGADEILDTLEIPTGIPVAVGYVSSIEGLFEEIIKEMNRSRPAYDMYAAALFMQIICNVRRKIKENVSDNMALRNKRVYQSLQYIQQNYHLNIRVSDLAQISYLSKNRYTSVFAELLGVTPKQYILTHKIQKAKELLLTTDLDIGEIALSIGYNDSLYFSRIFKEYVGMAPSAFRKSIKD